MTSRRSKGDGGLHWDDDRKRWIASVTIGYTPAGKRIVRKGSGKTKTEAKNKLKEVLRDHEDGLTIAPHNYTVANAVSDWLAYGLAGRAESTKTKNRLLAERHVIPDLGARKLRELTATDIDRWMERKARDLSDSTLGNLHSIMNRSVMRAMARDKVKRNVVVLAQVPTGQPGRPSKALSFEQAKSLLDAAEGTKLEAYLVLSLLIGARTEELRALRWDHVDLEGRPDGDSPQPPSINVWRSVRDGGDTKTRKSRRSLAMPLRCVYALRALRSRQELQRDRAGGTWDADGLVFASRTGAALDAANVRRSFRQIVKVAGLDPKEWTPRELRHSFVSILSAEGMTIERIAELCGHAGTRVTEAVYRHQLRPVLLGAAQEMDRIFRRPKEASRDGGEAPRP
ncbi:site-specific integrase [Hamadaea tsunoensis]|uniref:site-specific integrase n=1 Tax=Hamadaea tsunoensis TaxID=53368 RepID=UPI00040AA60F|nr:site-specific integrase [Hamadaea tsunoensis]